MSRTLLLATSAALAAGLSTACDRDVTGLANMVHVRVDSITPGPGSATIDFTVVNFASETVHIIVPCGGRFAFLDRREDGEWRSYANAGLVCSPCLICALDVVTAPAPLPLEEGTSISGRQTVEDDGVYRIRVGVHGKDGGDAASTPTSDVFVVEVGPFLTGAATITGGAPTEIPAVSS